MIEMLCAVAVLAFLFTLMAQMLGTITRSCSEGQQRVNNLTKARSMLDMMARDIQSGLYRSDLSGTVSSSASVILSLYTQRPGIGAGNLTRNVSLVRYAIDTSSGSTLQRWDYAVDWTPGNPAIPFSDPSYKLPQSTPRDTAPGVLACGVQFIQGDGQIVTAYNSSVRAVGITMAVVDDTTFVQLSNTGKLSKLIGLFPASPGGTERSLKSYWERQLESAHVWSGDYPQSLGTGLKIFERYVPITSQ